MQSHIVSAAFLACLAIGGCASPGSSAPAGETGSSPASDATVKKRETLLSIRDKTLADLYAEKPEVKNEIAKSVGYAVFDASQVNVVLFVGAMGGGVMVDSGDGRQTFMKMKRAGTGPGLGYKSYRQVMVFKDRKLFDQFRTLGADAGASADATMKTGGKGPSLDGSVSFNPLLSVYQMTDSGLLLQANWGGVAYLPDSELNR